MQKSSEYVYLLLTINDRIAYVNMKARMMHVNDLFERINDTKKLNVLVKAMLDNAIIEIKEQGVNPLIVETYRTPERQNYLYCQGRNIIEVESKGISKTFAKMYCNPTIGKITWTLNSIHEISKAVDVVPQRKVNGKLTAIWNVNDTQTKIIINTMLKYGFESGANWINNPDSPHFQVNGTFTNVFNQEHNTTNVAMVIQNALNVKVRSKLKVDGAWGTKTTEAVNNFRKMQGYKTAKGQIGVDAFKALLK